MNLDRLQNGTNSDQGISPVVGVILMVAVTVILAAVIGAFVLDLGSETETTAQAGISMSETNDGTYIQWITSGNVETVSIQVDGEEVGTLNNVGDSGTATSPADSSVTAVGVTEDGSESVVSSSDSPSDTGTAGFVTNQSSEPTESVTGVVSVNPGIEGAIVESRDSDGNVVDTTTTNADGEYEVGVFEDGSILVNVDGVNVNGTDFYAGYELDVTNVEEDINFNFTNVQSTTVNGNTVDVSYVIEGESENQIANVYQLQAVNENLSADYVLVNNIDANETSSWNSGAGFAPIGDNDDRFEGSFDGDSYTIDGLYIDRSNTTSVGLFASTDGAEISDVNLVNVDVTGQDRTGGLVGESNHSSIITDVVVSGNVDGLGDVGGLAGSVMNDSEIHTSYSSGLVNTRGGDRVGGLVGYHYSGTLINESYSSSNVSGPGNRVGGLVGWLGNSDATIENSYATGSVSGESSVGGLVGRNGGEFSSAVIINSYATGSVSGESSVGGLVGSNVQTVTESYWDTESSGQTDSAGGTGLTTDEMTGNDAESNMTEFDFTTVWETVDGDYPQLQSE